MKRSSIGGEEDKTRGSHRIDLDEQIPTSRLQLPAETRRDPEEGELERPEKIGDRNGDGRIYQSTDLGVDLGKK